MWNPAKLTLIFTDVKLFEEDPDDNTGAGRAIKAILPYLGTDVKKAVNYLRKAYSRFVKTGSALDVSILEVRILIFFE
jgi:hypothetical protein